MCLSMMAETTFLRIRRCCPHGPTFTQHVIKGGSFLCAPNYFMRYRSGARQGQEDDLATSHLGFRTILVAPAP